MRDGTGASVLPGLGLCAAITAVAMAAQALEERVAGHPYVEALVLAILIGIAVRTAWTPDARFRTGIAFSAKQLLEVAVVLLGASLSLGAILASGPALLAGIVGTVVIASAPASRSAGPSACRPGWRSWWPAATRSAATRPSPRWRR